MSSADQAVQVYQLRIWIRKISPQIWRLLLVRSDSTIGELHNILQIAFGWTDDHLHQFLIRGKPYGTGMLVGVQQVMTAQQIEDYVEQQRQCSHCGQPLACKGHKWKSFLSHFVQIIVVLYHLARNPARMIIITGLSRW